MSEVFTVFYSWQSDTSRRHGRDLVRESLDIACDTISRDDVVPFKISVYSDTENEPGLCNIPATILRRIREADAIVSDLTFIAMTEGDKSKFCSNPNVLFELGYAFSTVGPERLICVLNEMHGPAAEQIFDLAHHRRPIAFTSPKEEQTRSKTVKMLSKHIENALRGVVELGLSGGHGGDDEIMHQRQLSEVETYWHQNRRTESGRPKVAFWFRPKLFRKRRFADVATMEKFLRDQGVFTDRLHKFPPQVKGNAPMDWGLYNDIYGDPWALTYSGQFWVEFMIGGHGSLDLSQRDMQVSPEPPTTKNLEPYQWVPADALTTISTVFQFARNLSATFADSELVEWGVEATDLQGRWLDISQFDVVGPCRAPKIRRNGENSSTEFCDSYLDHFLAFGKDFVDLFCRDGRTLSSNDIRKFRNLAGEI